MLSNCCASLDGMLCAIPREYQELAAKRLEEIAKYRDAPVVAYLHKYHNVFGDDVWTTDHKWGERWPLESKSLIIKPGE